MKTRKLKYKWSVSAVPWINFYFFTVTCMSCVTQYLSSTSLTTEQSSSGSAVLVSFSPLNIKTHPCSVSRTALHSWNALWSEYQPLSSALIFCITAFLLRAAVGSCRPTAQNSLMPFLTHFSLVPQLKRAWVSPAAFTLISYLFCKFSSYINRHKTWGERSTVHQ